MGSPVHTLRHKRSPPSSFLASSWTRWTSPSKRSPLKDMDEQDLQKNLREKEIIYMYSSRHHQCCIIHYENKYRQRPDVYCRLFGSNSTVTSLKEKKIKQQQVRSSPHHKEKKKKEKSLKHKRVRYGWEWHHHDWGEQARAIFTSCAPPESLDQCLLVLFLTEPQKFKFSSGASLVDQMSSLRDDTRRDNNY